MVLYSAAGLCFAPAGLVYGLLVLSGHESAWAAAVLLVSAFLVAYLVWNKLDKRLATLHANLAEGYAANAHLNRQISQEFAYVDAENL